MNEKYMKEALSLAEEAFFLGEVPVGCVIVDETGNVIGKGKNRRETAHDASAHAEVEAIREACANRGDWRLDGCALYVTLEPCPMCAGAIINSRISEVVYGAKDETMGACGSVLDLFCENFPHHPRVFSNVCAEAGRTLLQEFFRENRRK